MKVQVFALMLCLSFSLPAVAEIDSVLGPFPALGSAEEVAEINQMLYYQATRTKADCDEAQLEADASLEVFFGKLLSPEELNRAGSKLKWITIKSGVLIYYQKSKYSRPRPYLTHSEIKPCIELESSKSYPSGHTTLARVYGRILSEMYPERAILFMQRADKVALNRVIGGVHHPSDIEAGKKLGDSIADNYLDLNDTLYNLKVADL